MPKYQVWNTNISWDSVQELAEPYSVKVATLRQEIVQK